MEKHDLDYFRRGKTENPKFWNRLGGMPGLRGKICCDIGCGEGSLAIDMAQNEANKVFGFDIDKGRIEFAKENLLRNFPQFTTIVEFHCMDFKDFSMTFDVITSKDACEHIICLKEMLISIEEKLNKNGLFFAGFGPVYNSPYGDHKRLNKSIIPWGHLIFPHTKEEIYDKGLNGLSLAEYKQILYGTGLEVLQFKVNESKNIISNLFSLISRVNFLREYFSHNIYAVLRRQND
jgi:cyclopropane fatty-acyl-phospholipid synthase-like methyltransferase